MLQKTVRVVRVVGAPNGPRDIVLAAEHGGEVVISFASGAAEVTAGDILWLQLTREPIEVVDVDEDDADYDDADHDAEV